MPLMVFNFYCAYSSQTIYDDYYITCYNLIFTAWPLLINAMFDKDFDYYRWTLKPKNGKKGPYKERRLEKDLRFLKYIPYLYYIGQNNELFSLKNLIWNIFYSVFVGTSMFLLIIYSVSNFTSNDDGHTVDIWFLS